MTKLEDFFPSVCYEAVEVIEAIEAVEVTEVIEAAELLRPEKSLVRTSESSRHLNSVLFL